jgi:hypothetical protein
MADDGFANNSKDVGSPYWWAIRLGKALSDRRPNLVRLHRYYDGAHPMSFASAKFREAFGGLFKTFADNWTALVVDAVEERLNIEGFRFGETEGDRDAWKIWQRNALDADSQIAHTEALISGDAYAIVWSDADDPSLAAITVESPVEVIVEASPYSRKTRAAGLKRWSDAEGYVCLTLYLPDAIYKWRSTNKQPDPENNLAEFVESAQWDRRSVPNEDWPLTNPYGVVPVVPLVNRPGILRGLRGRSEIADVLPVQDAINKLCADMLVASEFAAFRQRWATGLEIPTDPESGQALEPFKAAIDRLWTVEDAGASFGEFDATDLDNYTKAIELLVQHVASQTRTPPHYFYLSGQFPSGESIKSAETGLVAKARRKMRFFGEGWEEVMRLAFAVEGDAERAAMFEAETIWGDPESRSESEHVDAVTKMQALGVPQEALWEELGFTPQQIDRFREMRAERALEIALAGEALTPGAPPATNGATPPVPAPAP